MLHLTFLTSASIRTIARHTSGTIVLRLVAVRTVGIVARLAKTLSSFETRFTSFADIGVSKTVYAIWIFARVDFNNSKGKNYEDK